jgi:hypothetical protein
MKMAYGIDVAFNGGTYVRPGLPYNYTIKTGIKNLSLDNYTSAAMGIKALQDALGFYNTSGGGGNGGGDTNNIDSSSQVTIIHAPEIVDFPSNYNFVGPMSPSQRWQL